MLGKIRHLALPTILFALLIGASTFATAKTAKTTNVKKPLGWNDSICSYTWQSKVNNCDSLVTCFDKAWDGKIKVIPNNVSRITKDSLKVCMGKFKLTAPTIIIYVMDLSGSMFQVLYPNTGWENSGDPFLVRDDALREAFRTQRDTMPDSKAGYIGFTTDLVPYLSASQLATFKWKSHLLSPITIKDSITLNKVADSLALDLQTGYNTNYKAPLDRAIQWIQDTVICPTGYNVAIIFLSDGYPNTATYTQSQINFFNRVGTGRTDSVHIYGIAMGLNTGTALTNLCRATGGKDYLVVPDSLKNLPRILSGIVKSIARPPIPEGVTVSNKSFVPAVTANAINIVNSTANDSVWIVALDRFIPLKPLIPNQIEVMSNFSRPGMNDTGLGFMFYLDNSGTVYTNTCLICRPKSQIEVLVNNIKVDTLTWQNKTYTIRLNYYGTDTLASVKIAVKTINKNDMDTIILTNRQWNGKNWVFTGNVPLEVSDLLAVFENDTTEANWADIMMLKFKHPVDIMDSAMDTVIISSPANKMLIYDALGDPMTLGLTHFYDTVPNVANTNIIKAGRRAELYAKVFATSKWLQEYETNPDKSKFISWVAVDNSTGLVDTAIGTLSGTTGNHVSFFPKQAPDTMKITATLAEPGIPQVKVTIYLVIQVGPPKMIVIEASKDASISPHRRNDYDPITIFNNETTKKAYAILRDTMQNWVKSDSNAIWTTQNQNIVDVTPGPSDEVTITKQTNDSAATHIYAEDINLALMEPKDSSLVVCQKYYIETIRITDVINPIDTIGITSFVMETDNQKMLYTIGRRSDTKNWEQTNTSWFINHTGVVNGTPPQDANSWNVDPIRPDTGFIHVTKIGPNSTTLRDTVYYYIHSSEASKVVIELLTPDSLCIAGRTLLTEEKIYNQDGLVLGTVKYQSTDKAIYEDTLGDNGIPFKPFAKTINNGTTDSSIFYNCRATVEEWFESGIDSTQYELYWTSYHEDTKVYDKHKFRIWLPKVPTFLTAATREFVLKPDTLDYIILIPSDTIYNKKKTDSLFSITVKGYDKFGNLIPDQKFKWVSDSTLKDFKFNDTVNTIYINPNNAIESQTGKIIVNGLGTEIKKTILLTITVKPGFSKAITRDISGNGYLDRIDLVFEKRVFLTDSLKNLIDLSKFTVENLNPHLTFTVTSISALQVRDTSTIFCLKLSETNSISNGAPQTAWRPFLTITDPAFLSIVDPINSKQCADGAGPVIWTAIKAVKSANDRTKDEVTVTMSESFNNINGSSFMSKFPQPPSTINVWEQKIINNTFEFVKNDSLLSGITSFEWQQNTATMFKMSNGKNLFSNHLVNLDTINGYVADQYGNVPNFNNQKVRVQVNPFIGDITIGPNPFKINIDYFNENKDMLLKIIDKNTIINYLNENKGIVITIKINGDSTIFDPQYGIKVNIIVFDAVGNLVTKRTNNDVLNQIKNDPKFKWMIDQLKAGKTVELTFYWEGMTDQGMQSNPGVYKMVVYAKIGKDGKQKFVETVAVGK